MIEAILSNLYSIIGAVVMACFGAYLVWRNMACFGAYLVWRNGRKARVAAASAVFRSAFADALLNLAHNDVATATIVRGLHTRHLAAIQAFRPYVGGFGRSSFDASATEYTQRANAYSQQGPLVQFASEQGTQAQGQRAALRESIERLLKHAAAI